MLSQLFLFLTLAALFFLPGAALLVMSGAWARWPGLQRYVAAAGLSVAFYPVLFYTVRFIAPQAVLGAPVMGGALLLMAAVTGWGVWRRGAFSWQFTGWEWAAVFVLALTFLSRFWFAGVYSFPAWSDSLHHTLLTQLTAANGRLPFTLEPYFPNNMGMYHLGLYAISGTAAALSQVPAHSALLWTAQFFNALCGLGIYLVIDRYAGRPGAVVGLAVAGLFSAHPALWANWGRFTQLSAQALLPIAWVFLFELFPRLPVKSDNLPPFKLGVWPIFFAALTTAAVFLLHFRVAAFYLLLVGPTLLYLLWLTPSWRERISAIKIATAVGLLSLALVLPILWEAGHNHLFAERGAGVPLTEEQVNQARRNYFEFPLSTVSYLAAPVWLLLWGGASVLFGLWRRNWLIVVHLLWAGLLLILGNLYLLNIPALSVTNLGAILIMAYAPLSVVIGAAVNELDGLIPAVYRQKALTAGGILLLLACLPAAQARATTVESHRHFVMPADLAAMAWIEANMPDEATFAINVYFWLPNFAHGTDAGYWLPYFTGREIVTSSMLSDGATLEYRRQVLARSQAAERLKTDLAALDDLRDLGVTHIYIGARGNFADAGLQLPLLLQSERVELLYEREGAAVLRITE
jgi:hypothetical protein